MLFDLQSPGRKTAVRIIFGFLALIFATGFIFLGIGTEGGFNPFDSAGGSTDDALEQQIEDAQKEVDANPDDPDPLASLIVIRAQSGDRQLEYDEATGAPVALTENSRQEYEEAISLWQDYLEMEPRKVNAAAAAAIVQSYRFLGDVKGAIAAQEELVESDSRVSQLCQPRRPSVRQPSDRGRRQGPRSGACEGRLGHEEGPRRTVRAASKAGGQGRGAGEEAARLRDRRELRAVRPLRRAHPHRSGRSDSLTLATIEGRKGR